MGCLDGYAQYALVSEPHWRAGMDGEYTDLESSLFIQPSPDKAAIVACLQSISAILLIPVFGNKSEIYGILHPQPAKPLNIRFFPKVPFIRIAKWPITDGHITTEWVIADPSGLDVDHWKLELRDDATTKELRG